MLLLGGGGGTGLLNKGGGINRLPGLVTKQQAVEFPQVQASYVNFRTLFSSNSTTDQPMTFLYICVHTFQFERSSARPK